MARCSKCKMEFVDCMASHLESLARFIPVRDEVFVKKAK